MISRLHTFKSDSALSHCGSMSTVTVGMPACATTAGMLLRKCLCSVSFFCLSCRGEAHSDKYVCCCRASGEAIQCCAHADMMVVYFPAIDSIWAFFSHLPFIRNLASVAIYGFFPITVFCVKTANKFRKRLLALPSHAGCNPEGKSSSCRTGCNFFILEDIYLERCNSMPLSVRSVQLSSSVWSCHVSIIKRKFNFHFLAI